MSNAHCALRPPLCNFALLSRLSSVELFRWRLLVSWLVVVCGAVVVMIGIVVSVGYGGGGDGETAAAVILRCEMDAFLFLVMKRA